MTEEAGSEQEQFITERATDLYVRSRHNPELRQRIHESGDQRWAAAEDIRRLKGLLPHLPELPETAAAEIYERIREAEQCLVAPNLQEEDYELGRALIDDEIKVLPSSAEILMSAEHATKPVRKPEIGLRGSADYGTAGLAGVLAEEGDVRAIAAVGRQTGNANLDIVHPLKEEQLRQLALKQWYGVVALHGMHSGLVSDLFDESEYHGFIGMGRHTPRKATLEVARQLTHYAKEELGLRVAIGNETPYLLFEVDQKWDGRAFRSRTNELRFRRGELQTNKLAALRPGTTTNFMMECTTEDEQHKGIPIFQLELARSIMLQPDNLYQRDRRAAEMGIYMGYLLAKESVHLAYEAGGRYTEEEI